MAAVTPWPSSSNDDGWVNLHFSFPNKANPKELIKKGGWPFKTIEAFVSRVNFALERSTQFKDMWFCTSLQSKAGVNSKGKPKAERKKANAMGLKAIWVDIDVDDDPKHYHTVNEALTAILTFQVKVGLPAPSAIVFSGGGIHVYWISRDTLTPQEWHPYADGLKQLLLANNIKCDAGLTTDSARILRIPGTLNYKYDPPKPVDLAPGPLKIYDFPTKLAFLHEFSGPVLAAAPVAGFTLWAEGVTGKTFQRPSAAFSSLDAANDTLAAGIDKHEDFKLDPRPIFTKCGFYRTALKEGGASYNQPLWMLSVLGSTFMENGDAIAHKVSEGHASYSEADTQAMYDRKVAERSASGIGYPSCSAIAGSGCQACKTCPLFANGKSPLNIKPDPPKVTAAVTPGVQSQAALDAFLPDGFEFNGDGIVCKVLEQEDDGETITSLIPLFKSVLSKFWLQKMPGESLNFTATVDLGFVEQINVAMGEIAKTGFPAYLMEKRVLFDTRGEKYLKEFFVSTIGKLRSLSAAQQAVPFGWYLEKGKRRGFVYDGRVMMDDGTERPCGAVDQNIQDMYRPHGEMAEWMKAANCVLDRQRPELTAIMLTAFASPLMHLASRNTVMYAARGSDSGAGKSSAAMLGMSVWGDPIATKGTETQTSNNVTTIMKTIRNLPFYWDEVTDDPSLMRIDKLLVEADGGKEKGRNLDGQRTQGIGKWQLAVSYTANISFVEFLKKNNPNTPARLMRVLEWDVKRVEGGPGHMPDADATELVNLSRENYGHMGAVYAKYLSLNHNRIHDELKAKTNEIQHRLKAQNDERLWVAGMAMMIIGAGCARDCGLNVDPQEIEAFMYRVHKFNLEERDRFAKGGKLDNSESLLTRYLKQRDAGFQGIWTNYMHNNPGKPPKPVSVVHGPQSAHPNARGGIEFRFAIENRQLMIARRDFDKWIVGEKVSPSYIHASLIERYDMDEKLLQLGSGTLHNPGREDCLILNIKPNTPMWQYMTSWTVPAEVERMEAEPDQPDAPDIETGFEEALVASPGTNGVTADDVRAAMQGPV